MKPGKLKTKIFLDGGDPHETKEIIALLGFLDGQTTNPTLISKIPAHANVLNREISSARRRFSIFIILW